MMSEYIERETALQIIDNYAKTVSEDGLVVVNAIKDIVNIICPTIDVVEVVRCKDCLYNANGTCIHSESYDDTTHRPDYFCADGIRKEVQK